MDRSSSYRLAVEDQNMTQFHSEKNKVADFVYTLRDAQIPKSLKNTIKKPEKRNSQAVDQLSMSLQSMKQQ